MDNYDTQMLAERAKELECMYAVDEVLQNKSLTLSAAMMELVGVIPIGFTAPAACGSSCGTTPSSSPILTAQSAWARFQF